MDVLKYIPVLLVLFLGGGDTGGHGGSQHDHVKLHVPEFIHHDHHTKIITIHHHHHKPKEKHHHHHYHHHHKPHIPYGHHYHKHHKKSHTKTQTSISNHGKGANHHEGQQKYHGLQGNYGPRAHHGHLDMGHKNHVPHYDTPSFSYDSNPVTFEDDFKSYAPSVPTTVPQAPQVYGVQHTVKQVKVFDSLPGALPANTGSHGYEVTEEGEQSDDDAFTAINSLSQTYPGTFGFIRNAGIDSAQNDVLGDIPIHSSIQTNHASFASAPQPTSYANMETFSSGQGDPFSSVAPTHDFSPSVSPSHFPLNVEATGFDDPANVYSGDITGTALVSADDVLNEDTPVSFSREAGIQETTKTGAVETVVY